MTSNHLILIMLTGFLHALSLFCQKKKIASSLWVSFLQFLLLLSSSVASSMLYSSFRSPPPPCSSLFTLHYCQIPSLAVSPWPRDWCVPSLGGTSDEPPCQEDQYDWQQTGWAASKSITGRSGEEWGGGGGNGGGGQCRRLAESTA